MYCNILISRENYLVTWFCCAASNKKFPFEKSSHGLTCPCLWFLSRWMINFIYIWNTSLVVPSTSFCKNMANLVNWPYVVILTKSCLGLHIYTLKKPSIGESSYTSPNQLSEVFLSKCFLLYFWLFALLCTLNINFTWYAHVFRDIKGANILVDPNGRVKLADFGMAKHVSANRLIWFIICWACQIFT